MQTETSSTEEEIQVPPHRGLDEKEQERKKALQAKKAKAHDRLPAKEDEELTALLQVEKQEHDRQAAIHKLIEQADKYGRKEIGRVRKEITDRVKALHEDERTELAGVEQIYRKSRTDMEKEMKAAMQRIQEQHNQMMGELQAGHDKDVAAVRDRYRDGYKTAEVDIDTEIDRVASLVTSFNDMVQGLELPQLQKLQAEGILQLNGNSKGGDFLVVPGSGKE